MKKSIKRKVHRYMYTMYIKNNLMQNEIEHKEKYLNKECSKIWEFINPHGDKYLFGMFEDIIVTLGYFHPTLHKFIAQY